MEAWQNDPVAPPEQTATESWQNDPIAPSAPNIAPIQKMAVGNIAANDNKVEDSTKPPQTPQERLNTAVGQPLHMLLNPDDQTPIGAPMRKAYTNSLRDGSASSFGDFLQTALPTVAHIAARGIKSFEEVGNAIQAGGERAAGTLAYPFLSEEHRQKLIESGMLGEVPTLTGGTVHDIIAKAETRANALLSPGIGAAFTTVTAPLTPIVSPILNKAPEAAEKIGVSKENASLIPGTLELGMNLLGIGGLHYAETLREAVGKRLDKLPADVTPEDINHTIAHGVNHKAPTAQDFKAVEQATGIPEQAQHNLYNETGVKPEQLYTDAERNPSIVSDVVAGKVPEQYEHLVEPKPVLPTEQTGKLIPAYDEATRAWRVIDKEGDHIQGGFDSAEEAREYIEDEKFKAEEKQFEEEKPITYEGGQAVIPGAEKATEAQMAQRGTEAPLKAESAQQPANEGLFDIASRAQGALFDQAMKGAEAPTPEKLGAVEQKAKPNVIPPSAIGKPTSLRTFLSNNGAKFNEGNELVSIKANGNKLTGESALEYAHQIAKENGYLPQDEANTPAQPVTDLQNALTEDGGRGHFRDADQDRVLKMRENAEAKRWQDPAYIEHQAASIGLDTEKLAGETDKQHIRRLVKALTDFYKEQGGSAPTDIYRKILGETIIAAEKFTGKLGGRLFARVADAYKGIFQPELFGPIAKRADAYLAKYKASLSEARNSWAQSEAAEAAAFAKLSEDDQKAWLYDHETGRWNPEDNPDHAKEQALYDAAHQAEQEAGVGTDAYKENYLPHQFEKPEEVKAFFNSEPMIRKYGKDWFNKASTFQLVQEADRAGFRLKTYNHVLMRNARLLASDSLIRTMDLFNDLKRDGAAVRSTAFTLDKKIARTEQAIKELEKKYKAAFEKKNPSNEPTLIKELPPAESRMMQLAESRMAELKARLDNFNKEKADLKLTPEQLAELKNGIRAIGPDNHAWNIHQQAAPVWKNAMEMKGLWERQGLAGDFYRNYMGGKAIYINGKMLASLWHPTHEMVIDLSNKTATALHHLIQGGDWKDFTTQDIPVQFGISKENFKLRDSPSLEAYHTPREERTEAQQKIVDALNEGGLIPAIPEDMKVAAKENFQKAIDGIGMNNLRLIESAIQLPAKALAAPMMEHWIPAMKVEAYLRARELAMKRDPTLENNAGKRAEVSRQIAKEIERNYGEMSRSTLFWNPIIRDVFRGTEFSLGWKLAALQNFRGLAELPKAGYNFLKTGEFSREQITHQMLQSYIYTANMLIMGAALNYMFTGAAGALKDWMYPQTGEKNADGTPIRLRTQSFFNEPMMLMKDINEDGVVAGSGSFLYHQSLLPSIKDTLLGQDFLGRPYITDPTDLQQWKNYGLDTINPILAGSVEQAEAKGSKIAERMAWLGFPMAGTWVNQSPTEQRIIGEYDKLNPAKGTAYQAKLKADMKIAISNHDAKAESDISKEMKREGMEDWQIRYSKEPYKKPFAEGAWEKLPHDVQERLHHSMTPEEKKKFKIKSP